MFVCLRRPVQFVNDNVLSAYREWATCPWEIKKYKRVSPGGRRMCWKAPSYAHRIFSYTWNRLKKRREFPEVTSRLPTAASSNDADVAGASPVASGHEISFEVTRKISLRRPLLLYYFQMLDRHEKNHFSLKSTFPCGRELRTHDQRSKMQWGGPPSRTHPVKAVRQGIRIRLDRLCPHCPPSPVEKRLIICVETPTRYIWILCFQMKPPRKIRVSKNMAMLFFKNWGCLLRVPGFRRQGICLDPVCQGA